MLDEDQTPVAAEIHDHPISFVDEIDISQNIAGPSHATSCRLETDAPQPKRKKQQKKKVPEKVTTSTVTTGNWRNQNEPDTPQKDDHSRHCKGLAFSCLLCNNGHLMIYFCCSFR